MKKIKYLLSILLLVILLIPINTNAKTLGQYKSELDELQRKHNDTSNQIQYNESQIAAAKARVNEIYAEIQEGEKEMIELNKQIAQLNEDILKKRDEIKSILKYNQYAKGESAYLEYLFKAKSITDFIYRATVSEQMSNYNKNLINEMNAMIKQNEENIKKLQEKEKELTAKKEELNQKIAILQSQNISLSDESISEEEEIKASKEVIAFYEKAGCKDGDEVTTCAAKQLPPGTKFYRPVTLGYVTSEYGYRIDPLGSSGQNHTGIDMSTYRSCSECHSILSVAPGKVAYTGYNSSMGNYIVIHHNINGQYYSSMYMHLSRIDVRKGDIVTKDTQIGVMGNTGWSTATHLHLTMFACLYLSDSRCKYPGSTVNPRNYVNFPSGLYVDFKNRTTYYD